MIAARLAPLALLTALSSCVVGRQLTAEDADFTDYRAFRVAAHEGTRLSRALRYVSAHPGGQWTAEVRAAFDAEEPAYFANAQVSRDAARNYLVDLPNGPHADAALALLIEYSTKTDDVDTARLLRNARSTEAKLESAASRRRAVGEAILASVGALSADGVYGARIEDTPPELRHVLGGEAPVSWGTTPQRRDADYFFLIPTTEGRQSRVATIRTHVVLEAGVVAVGRIDGMDLFVRWDESDLVRPLDASSSNHRSAAAFHAQELLAGALEARLPAARCDRARGEGELLHRECDGWIATVAWGAREGEPDVITIRGPAAAKVR